MATLAQQHHRANEGQPDKRPSGNFFGNQDAVVEGVAQDDVAEHQHHHGDQADDPQHLEQGEIAFDNFMHDDHPADQGNSRFGR
ncbi:hypothetical protein D9M68_952840 [compost metagenome]